MKRKVDSIPINVYMLSFSLHTHKIYEVIFHDFIGVASNKSEYRNQFYYVHKIKYVCVVYSIS